MGEHYVPIAVPEAYYLTQSIKFLSTNRAILIYSSVGICFCSLFSKAFLSTFNLALCRILRKNPLP